jgi:hypothetical protein
VRIGRTRHDALPMRRPSVLFHCLILTLLGDVFAQGATFNLDVEQSRITLSGNVAGFTLREQGQGSLTTTVAGTISIATGNGQIQITSARLDPNVNGSWAPGRGEQATSPADLAGQSSTLFGTITGALRDLLVTATSTPRNLEANGQFDASAIVFQFPGDASSVLDYDSFLTGRGSRPLASAGTNQTATVGTLVSNNGVQTLTLALDAVFEFSLVSENDTALTLKGQLVATSTEGPAAPDIVGVELVDGQVRITVSGASEASQLESSTDLTVWVPAQATGVPGANGTRVYTVARSGAFQFFRTRD